MKRGILKYILSLVLFIAAPVHAGGPLSVCSGVPGKYSGAGTVTLNYDQGNLGSRSKAQADALVTEAVSLWTNVATATVTLARGSDLPVDVTTANYFTYGTSTSDGLNPVIYDTDGSIIDMLQGIGAKNHILGFAGSSWNSSTCQYIEGRAVINGFIAINDTTMKIVLAHEVGHLIGLDHTQLDSTQGLSSSNYPLMYPIANRGTVTLHEDDVAAVSALYPESNLSSVYGQLTGTFTQATGTPIRGANLWAEETTSHRLFSIVSDYLKQNTGYFKLLLPAGNYTLHAEAVQTNFTGGSSVGPYSDLSSDPSFQSPLYVGGVAMTPVTLGNATPTQIAITAGCAATAGFKLDGSGTVSVNCGSICSYTLSPTSQSAAATGLSGTITVSSTSADCAWTAVSNASWATITSGASGSGNGIVVYSVAANTGSSSRTGTLTIAGQTFTLTQAGAASANPDVFPLNGVMPAGWITTSGANAGWAVTSDDKAEGNYSLKSSPISDLQKAQIEITKIFTAGSVSFARRVSSESGYDFLRFYIDGVKQQQWSGEQAWATFSYSLSAGSHTLRWSYEKDDFVISGSDAAWIDAVSLPAETSATVPGAPTIIAAAAGNGSATLSFTAPASNGGAAITGYTATCSASGQTTRTGTRSASPITVSGLVNGVTYSCNLVAINSVGTGPASNTMTVTPVGLGDPWTALSGTSPSRPSLALNSGTGKTQMVVRAASDQLWMGNFDTSGTFEGWNQMPGASPSPVAQAWHPTLNKMVMVARSASDQLYLGTFDSAGSFEGWNALPGTSPSAVALAWHPTLNKMYMVARSTSDQLYLGTFNSAGNFEGWSALPGTSASPSPVALAWHPTLNKMYMVARSASDQLWLGTFNSVGSFEGWNAMPGTSTSPSPVALAWHPTLNKMYMAARSTSDQLWQGTFSSTSGAFEGWSALSGTSPTAPVLAAGQSKLQLVVRTTNDQLWSMLLQ